MGELTPLVAAARRAPDQPALVWRDEAIAYRSLLAAARATAGFLAQRGLGPGARVAVLARPCPAWVALAHAALATGITLVPLNLRLGDAELATLLARARPDLLLVDEEHRGRVVAPRVALLGDVLAGVERELPEELDPSRVAAILFTSGTTGTPKGAMLTAGQLLASARGACEVLGLGGGDRWLVNMPLFHVGGFGILWRMALAGGTVVLHDRFELAAASEAVARHRVTLLSLVPAMLRRLLDETPQALEGSVRAVMLGGAPIPPDLVARCPQALASYGLTETCSHVTLVRPGADASERATSGRAMPGTRVRVVDEAGCEVPPGEPGGIEVQGPTVFAGYLDDPHANAAARRQGWLRTGDDGVLDDSGCLTVLSRRTDLLVVGGENVYPAELELVLEGHPAIAEAAVVGLADPTWGQVPAALVAWRGEPVAFEELETYLGSRLARYKRPRHWQAVEALPRLASGKLDRVAAARMVKLNPEFPSR